MAHENILFYLRTGESEAFLISAVEVVEIDGKFLTR